jgi:hypothetical protein
VSSKYPPAWLSELKQWASPADYSDHDGFHGLSKLLYHYAIFVPGFYILPGLIFCVIVAASGERKRAGPFDASYCGLLTCALACLVAAAEKAMNQYPFLTGVFWLVLVKSAFLAVPIVFCVVPGVIGEAYQKLTGRDANLEAPMV